MSYYLNLKFYIFDLNFEFSSNFNELVVDNLHTLIFVVVFFEMKICMLFKYNTLISKEKKGNRL